MFTSRALTRNAVRSGAAVAAASLLLELSPVVASADPNTDTVPLPQGAGNGVNTEAPGEVLLPGGGFAFPDSLTIPGTVPAPTQYPDGPTPKPFRPDHIWHLVPSDVATDHVVYDYVVSPFRDLRANHPEVMEQNLETVVRLNNAARDDVAAQELALDDDYLDPLVNLSSGLGENLGKHFRDAFEERRLPKTKDLLSGNLARAGGVVSSTFFEKYTYDYDRPFVVAPERIERYYREGQDDPYSETPSYPSGHTNKAAWTATLLAIMLPEVAPQIQARASEAGQSRLVLGVHYPLDVMGGRMMGNQAAADRWADPQFRPLIQHAMLELRRELEFRCGDTIANCVAKDNQYLSNEAAVQQYTERMTYDFQQIGATDVPVVVPARYETLLETRFPQLNAEQRKQILEQTAIASGYPLDRNDGQGQHVRMNLARALAAEVRINDDGSVTVVN